MKIRRKLEERRFDGGLVALEYCRHRLLIHDLPEGVAPDENVIEKLALEIGAERRF